jgi:hypothetical protein
VTKVEDLGITTSLGLESAASSDRDIYCLHDRSFFPLRTALLIWIQLIPCSISRFSDHIPQFMPPLGMVMSSCRIWTWAFALNVCLSDIFRNIHHYPIAWDPSSRSVAIQSIGLGSQASWMICLQVGLGTTPRERFAGINNIRSYLCIVLEAVLVWFWDHIASWYWPFLHVLFRLAEIAFFIMFRIRVENPPKWDPDFFYVPIIMLNLPTLSIECNTSLAEMVLCHKCTSLQRMSTLMLALMAFWA